MPFGRKFLKLAAFAALVVFALSLGARGVCLAFYFGGVTIRDEKEMGREFDALVRARMPVIQDPEVRHYVEDTLKKLLKGVPKQPYSFKPAVILNDSMNAFAVPGGYIYILTGMIMNVDDEAELAGVMAHELAHVTQRHVAQRLERAQFFTLGSLLAAIAGVAIGGPAGAAAAVAASGASQSAMLNYSRIDESDADTLGLQFLTAAGYPPRGMVDGFKKLRRKAWLNGVGAPTYLSTHPAIGDRINNIGARIAAMPAAKRNAKLDNSRFERVQTLLWARYGDEQAALLKFSGSDALSQMGRGIVLSRQNKIREAGAAFDKALAAGPNDPLVAREAGIFHFRKGDMNKAERLLTDAVRKDPKDYMASFYYGRLLDETGREAQAPRYYRETLARAPEEPEVHRALARSLAKSGRQGDAYIHLAYAEIYANNRKLAKQYYEQAEAAGDRKSLAKLKSVYEERKRMWEGK